MALHDYVIDNSTGANVRADINSVLQAILTNNSSGSAPSTTAAYMWWADTTTGTLKIRNSANNGWVELLQLDGTLTLEDGSVSAPGLAFRDDLNTGIYSSAADTFNVATGGVERMELGAATVFNEDGADVDFRIEGDTEPNLFFLDASTGRIGIGTNSPNHNLEVAGNIGINANLTHNGDTDTRLSFSAANQVDIVCGGTTIGSFTTDGIAVGNNKRIDIFDTSGHRSGMINNSDSGANSLRISADPDNSGSSTSLQLHVDGSEVFRAASTGNCAIGTTAANNRLEIAKAAHYVVTDSGQARNGIHIRGNGGNENEYGGAISFGCNNTGAAAIAAVQGASDSDVVGLAFFTHESTSGAVDAAERARFSAVGDFFIGTTTVNPGINNYQTPGTMIRASNGDYIAISREQGTSGFFNRDNSTGAIMSFAYNGTQRGTISTDGSVISVTGTSDYRLKENNVNISDGITRLKQLKPYRFNFKETPSKTIDGFFAHEVSTVVPEAVFGEKDAVSSEDSEDGSLKKDVPIYQQLDNSKLVPLLVAAVKELITKVETLEAA